MPVATAHEPQDFWLEELEKADLFNSWVFEKIEPFLGNSILEIGCGTGNFTTLLAVPRRSVTAVDIQPKYAEATARRLAGRNDIEVICADATTMDINRRFDTIVMLDVLEHIEDDVGFLKRLKQLLQPEGRMVLKVPSGQWLYGSMDKAIGHYRRYTRQSLAIAATAAGLKLDTAKPFNRTACLGWWLNGRLLKRLTPPAAQVQRFNRLLPVVRRLEEMVPLPFGLSLIAVAGLGLRT